MTDRGAQVEPNAVPFIIKFSVMYYKSRPNHTAKPTIERVSACCAYQPKGDGREVRCKSDYHQSSGARGKSKYHAQQLHFTTSCHRNGAAPHRFVARIAHATNGIKADKQVYTQKSKENKRLIERFEHRFLMRDDGMWHGRNWV